MGSGSSKPNNSSNNSLDKPINNLLLNGLVSNPITLSAPSGAKKAILIGSNYTGTINQLSGCINDVNEWKTLLTSWGFTIDYFMTDLESGINYASKDNILNNLTTFINSLNSGDVGFIYYSGHGTMVVDEANGDEISGKDSVIVPADYKTAGLIIDDVIRSKLIQAKTGVNIFAGFDSCDSGSVCDLRYNLFDTSYRSDPTISSRVFDINSWILRQQVITNTKYIETAANIISFSGCKDGAFSYEASYNGKPYGALSITLIKVLQNSISNITIPNLVTTVKGVLNGLQVPSLMTGNAFETDIRFRDFLKI